MTDAKFEAQCDCELDSPGPLSHLPVEERLTHWTDWALYLKKRIETHYRPALTTAERERDDWNRRFLLLQHAASCDEERDCDHPSITGDVCDGCGAYLKTVRLDDIGLVSTICDYQRLESERDEALAEIERMKVCGNCLMREFSDVCDGAVCLHDENYVEAHHHCHFTPSLWTARNKEEET
jgi:hypothetical protein